MRVARAIPLVCWLGLQGLSSGAATPAADVYELQDGDRISGRTVVKGKRSFGVQTPYGRLDLPREKVARIRYADGRVEDLTQSVPVDAKATGPILILKVSGGSFWHAWDPKQAGVDSTLRLALSLDERVLVRYEDAAADPEDLRGANVNTFHFAPDQIKVTPEGGVRASPPETQPGRITLTLRLPESWVGTRRLRVAYQINAANALAPAWQDIASANLELGLKPRQATVVQVAQDPGQMEYSHRRMRKLETFKLELGLITGP